MNSTFFLTILNLICVNNARLQEERFNKLSPSVTLHGYLSIIIPLFIGCTIAQAVSRWLPTVAAWVRAWVWSCGNCGGQSGAGVVFLQVRWFPLPIIIPPIAPQSPSYIILGWYNRPVVAAVPSGLSCTPLRIVKRE
jgi:hypothetical protein